MASFNPTSDSGRTDSDGPRVNHESDEGITDRTIIGETTTRRYDDAAGFESEGKIVQTHMDNVPENFKMVQAIHPDNERQHTIKKILSRPVKIATVTFSTDDLAGTNLGQYDIMNTVRSSPGFALAREKLSTFYGVNWRAHLKVTLNPQPFESGLFQIYFIPFLRSTGSPLPTAIPADATLPFTTGCPNVFCNISLQSEIELSVPYTGPIPFINMTNTNMDFGTFNLQSIVPISDSTNNASCELSIYMYFSEIELFGSTPNNLIAVPQMMSKMQSKETKKKSGPLTTLGNSLLPILDSLGLSAPTANLNPERRHLDPYASPATADTIKTPLKVSFLSTQQVDIGQLGVDKTDECDINHIISKPTYYNQFSWTTTNEALTRLISYPVEPQVPGGFVINGRTYVAPNRLRYMSNIFRYWRGTIKFTFMVIANKFHSGRLRFVYTLGGDPPATMNALELFPRSFTHVVDIRDATCFEIDCEYFASTAWRLVPQAFNGTNYTNPNPGYLDDLRPSLSVYVENELRASSTTSQSIQIVCTVSGGPDFKFSTPISTTSFPIDFALPAPAQTPVAEPQSLSYNQLSMVGESDYDKEKHPEPFTTGEHIQNVRTLMRRYQLIGTGIVTLTTGQPTADFAILPYYNPLVNALGTLSDEMFPYFRKLFSFYRGSVRYLITSSDNSLMYTARYNADNSQTQPTLGAATAGQAGIFPVTAWPGGSDFNTYPLTANIPFASNLQGGLEIEFPYYSRYHKCLSEELQAQSSDDYQGSVSSGLVPIGIAYFQLSARGNASTPRLYVYRTVGDDFNYGYLLGAPITTTQLFPNP